MKDKKDDLPDMKVQLQSKTNTAVAKLLVYDTITNQPEKEYVAYVDEYGTVLIDYNNGHFKDAYPYTTKNLTELERGYSRGGKELVKIFGRLDEVITSRAAKAFELFMERQDNGIAVWNRSEIEHGNYKKVAYISPEGTVTWHVKPGYAPFQAVVDIRERAEHLQNQYEVRLSQEVTNKGNDGDL